MQAFNSILVPTEFSAVSTRAPFRRICAPDSGDLDGILVAFSSPTAVIG